MTDSTECPRISQADALELLEKGQVVIADIRDPNAFEQAHFTGSTRISNENLSDFIREQTDIPVIVVCYHGVSSQKAAQYMVDNGVQSAFSLDGGFNGWIANHGVQFVTQN